MRYCSQCGSDVEWRVPDGDNRDRHVCSDCGTIHYNNPKVVTGCLVEHDQRILFCKRAIEPCYGLWTLPAGFLELGETVEAGAARETYEEARADVEILDLFSMFSLTHIGQIYMIFRGRLKSLDYAPGPESLEVKLLHEELIPWREIAFPVIDKTLRLYLEDRKRGEFRQHIGEMRVIQNGNGRRIVTRMLNQA